MGIKKFLNDVADFLDLDHFNRQNKKKAVKTLIAKLEKRKQMLKKSIAKCDSKKEKKALKEEQELIQAQLKKANKYLRKLENK